MKNKQSAKYEKSNDFFIIGIDEVGRGALAGPVMAAAVVMINSKFKTQHQSKARCWTSPAPKQSFWCGVQNLRDSKKLSQKQREEFYRIITKHLNIDWAIGRASEKTIDKINIWEATKMAMKKAIKNLERKMGKKLTLDKTILIIDGNQGIGADFLEMPIVKADEKIFLCSCASIIAKVKRDALMKKHGKIYSQYGFAKHKGYPTQFHKKMIRKYGFSPIHRKSFKF